METTLTIEGKKELTKNQLQVIKMQTVKYTIDDIDGYETACKILNREPSLPYLDKQDWAFHQLKTIIAAANFIDNGNEIWKADFTNKTQPKYYPWFEKTGGGLVLYLVDDDYCNTFVPSGVHFKIERTCKEIVKRFLPLYNEWLS
jgi:hypothetical protein